MLFKLSLRNLRKSIKDYSVYFFTLILGIAIFYVFNTMESSSAMMTMTQSMHEMVYLLSEIMKMLSIFVSVILGFLIIYANNFIMKRRKKEFGVYILLGMKKVDVSRILLLETIMVGVASLVVGLIIGVLGSQFMSILIARLFEADMSGFVLHFDMDAMISTIMYFAIIYIFVMMFSALSVSSTKLIDLINSSKKTEDIKLRNPWLCIGIFIIASCILGYAYYTVTIKLNTKGITPQELGNAILFGCIGTLLLFYSFSGFLLKVVQSSKRFYFKGLNMFVVRQMNAKVNTTVISMSIISILLFMSICVLSSGLSINQSVTSRMQKYTPMDVEIELGGNLPVNYKGQSLKKALEKENIDMDVFEDTLDFPLYYDDELLLEDVSPTYADMTSEYFRTEHENILSLSDYNRLAKSFGNRELSLKSDEYAIVADFDAAIEYRNVELMQGRTLEMNGRVYKPAYRECQDGFVNITYLPMNTGYLIFPDEALRDVNVSMLMFFGKYKDGFSDEEITLMNEDIYNAASNLNDDIFEIDPELYPKNEEGEVQDIGYTLHYVTKQVLYESSVGTSALATFIGLYLSIVFLITSAALLALKQLSDSNDNVPRYDVLRKIGADQKMINRALLGEVAVFFMLPLAVALLHSYFGIQFCLTILEAFSFTDMWSSILITASFIVGIYGGYFVLTYLCCRRIIRNA